jgi:hypothetical protein
MLYTVAVLLVPVRLKRCLPHTLTAHKLLKKDFVRKEVYTACKGGAHTAAHACTVTQLLAVLVLVLLLLLRSPVVPALLVRAVRAQASLSCLASAAVVACAVKAAACCIAAGAHLLSLL